MIARIQTIPPGEAQGELQAIYKTLGSYPPHILQIHSLNPPTLKAHLQYYKRLMFGPSPLSPSLREMIATVVSKENNCHY